MQKIDLMIPEAHLFRIVQTTHLFLGYKKSRNETSRLYQYKSDIILRQQPMHE